MTIWTRSTAVRALAVTLAVTACGACSSDDDPTTSGTSPSTSSAPPAPSSTPSATDDTAEQEILTAHDAFWDARITSTNGPDPSPDLFAGIATEEVIALHVGIAESYVDDGIVRTGEPRVYNRSVEIDGDAAVITSCVDDSAWVGTKDGETLPPNPDAPSVRPVVRQALRVDGGWLIANTIEAEGDIEC